MANKTEFLVLRVLPDLKVRLKEEAKDVYEPVSELVRAMIEDVLAEPERLQQIKDKIHPPIIIEDGE